MQQQQQQQPDDGFRTWRKAIDARLLKEFGLSGSDFVDIAWRDIYDNSGDPFGGTAGYRSVCEALADADEIFAAMNGGGFAASVKAEADAERLLACCKAKPAKPLASPKTPLQWVCRGVDGRHPLRDWGYAQDYGHLVVATNGASMRVAERTTAKRLEQPIRRNRQGREECGPTMLPASWWHMFESNFVRQSAFCCYEKVGVLDFKDFPNPIDGQPELVAIRVFGKTFAFNKAMFLELASFTDEIFISDDITSPVRFTGKRGKTRTYALLMGVNI